MKRAVLMMILCSAVSAAIAGAEEIMITASRDNTLYQDPQGAISNGAGESLFVGNNSQSNTRRALVYFPVNNGVPVGAVINEVAVMLYMSQSGAGPTPVSLNRMTSNWGEGTSDAPGSEGSGAPATPGDATWLHRFYDTEEWYEPGGDFRSEASATAVVDATGFYVWENTQQLRADVQAWLDDPGANHGWIVRGIEDMGATAKRFASSDNQDDQLHPVIMLDYTLPVTVPATSTWGLVILTLSLATALKLMQVQLGGPRRLSGVIACRDE
ncbi:MAG: DNRLRE domain-containing protein [Planctomycetota bacterium]